MVANNYPAAQWQRPMLIAAAFITFLRAVIGLYQPDYWSPRTSLDYAAVAGTSLSFLFLAAGLWGFYLHHPAPPGRAQAVWRSAVAASCIAAATIGLSNFLEDALNVNGLGWVWVIGFLTLTVSLLMAGIIAFWVKGLPPWAGGLLLACAASLLFIGSWGWFILGPALLILGWLKG